MFGSWQRRYRFAIRWYRFEEWTVNSSQAEKFWEVLICRKWKGFKCQDMKIMAPVWVLILPQLCSGFTSWSGQYIASHVSICGGYGTLCQKALWYPVYLNCALFKMTVIILISEMHEVVQSSDELEKYLGDSLRSFFLTCWNIESLSQVRHVWEALGALNLGPHAGFSAGSR